MVLVQRDNQQAQLMDKINKEAGMSQDKIQSLIMPFQTSSGQIQFGKPSQDLSFFNNKVFKPIRGGGGGNQGPTRTSDKAIDFSTFQRQNQREKSRAPNFTSSKDQKRSFMKELSLTRANDISVRGPGSTRSSGSGMKAMFKTQE